MSLTGLDLYYADLAKRITTAGEELDDLGHDLYDLLMISPSCAQFTELRVVVCLEMSESFGLSSVALVHYIRHAL